MPNRAEIWRKTPDWVKRVWSWLDSPRGAFTALMALYILAVLVTGLVINAGVHGPMHFNDEVRYWEIAQSLFDGRFTFKGNTDYPPFYSISLLPVFALFSPQVRYAAALWLNVLYLCSAIFPAYLLLRRFDSRRMGLLAALVLLVSPIQVVIPRVILSENVFYPLFLWALLLAFTRLSPQGSRARVLENLLFGILLGLLVLTRFIALALIPALLLAWWLKPEGKEKPPLLFSWEKAGQMAWALLPLALIMGGWLMLGASEGLPVKDVLGFSITSDTNPAQLGNRHLLMWALFYGAYTLLVAAPVLALLLAALTRLRLKDWREEKTRWWLTVALVVFFLLIACIRHSWRAAYNFPDPVKLQGRYVMIFGPIFLISAFGAQGELGKTRLRPWARAGLMLASAALIALAYAFLFEGLFLVEKTPGPSANSPFGSMMLVLKAAFVVISATGGAVCVLLIGRRRALLAGVLSLYLATFFLYGNMLILQRLLVPRQLLNTQAHETITWLHSTQAGEACGLDGTRGELIRFSLPEKNNQARYIRSWHQALAFKGYPQHEFAPDTALDDLPGLIFQAECGELRTQLVELEAGGYTASILPRFTLVGKYYEFRPAP